MRRICTLGLALALAVLAPAVPAQAGRTPAPAPAPTVRVAAHNTLSGIAAARCGRASAWPALFAANRDRIRDPDLIYPGQVLRLGCIASYASRSAALRSVPTAAWVHPIRAGLHGIAPGACWGAPRAGHTHKGVDLIAAAGTRIRAAHAGHVAVVRYDADGAGWYVALAHGGGWFTVYEHMRSRSPLSVGAAVAGGATIGYVGATGNAHGPHLHFEVHHGLWHPVNPGPFMRAHGASVGC